jgi:hypothetical protein
MLYCNYVQCLFVVHVIEQQDDDDDDDDDEGAGKTLF